VNGEKDREKYIENEPLASSIRGSIMLGGEAGMNPTKKQRRGEGKIGK